MERQLDDTVKKPRRLCVYYLDAITQVGSFSFQDRTSTTWHKKMKRRRFSLYPSAGDCSLRKEKYKRSLAVEAKPKLIVVSLVGYIITRERSELVPHGRFIVPLGSRCHLEFTEGVDQRMHYEF